MVCRSQSNRSPESDWDSKIAELRLNLAVARQGLGEAMRQVRRSRDILAEMARAREAARQREQMEQEPPRKTDALLTAIGVEPPARIPDADASAAINRQADAADARDAKAAEVADLDAESSALTAVIERIDQDKADRIAGAKLPLKDLSVSDGGVLYQGVPFEQASAAEKLRVSVAMAVAANPKLRVMLVRDGSLLDADGMRVLAEMADAHDVQVWIERVETGGHVGVVIEDGEVVASKSSKPA